MINRLKEHSLVQMAQRVGALTQPACPLDTLFKSVNVSNQIDTHLREYNESVSSSETSSIIFRPTVPGRIFVVGRDCMGWSGVLDERPDVVEQCELSAFLVSDHSIATGYLAELEKCRSIIYGT